MPVYDFICPTCGNVQEGMCSISTRDEFHPECKECGAPTNRVFIASNIEMHVVFSGSDWTTKNLRENRYRQKRAQDMDRRQRDNHHVPALAPNVDGERVDSWGDAKKLAKERGHDVGSFDDKVRNLKGSP